MSLAGFTQPITKRGFTGHEMVDDMGIIHMNGRIYDARIARFLQADPFIQAATNTQSFNRYSYVLNNPLNATDPSGFIFHKLKKELKRGWNSIRPYVGAIVAVVMTYFCGPYCGQTGYILLTGAVSGAAGAAANGGNIIQGALFGAFSSVAYIAGGAFGAAMWGGVQAEVSGGSFGHGFIAAGIGAFGGGGEPGWSGFIRATVLGGVATKITGGKFKSGAASAAFMFAVSAGVQRIKAGGEQVTAEKTGEDGSGGVDKSTAANLELQKRAKEIADQIDIPDADYDIRFASAKEIKAVTKGQAAWGTVTRENGRWTILMEETLSTRMDGTRFTQTLAEELVHVEQLSTGYYKNLNPSTRRYALETEATGWVISYAPTLGLKGADYRDYVKIHNMWESKWKKQLY